MVRHTGKHPGQLKDQVISPAGTTIAVVQEFEKGAFRGTLISGVVVAATNCHSLIDVHFGKFRQGFILLIYMPWPARCELLYSLIMFHFHLYR
jgi:hypothetical protein